MTWRENALATTQRMATVEGPAWTVSAGDCSVVGPVKQYLEYLRSTESSPNTVRSYARGLALWWSFLERRERRGIRSERRSWGVCRTVASQERGGGHHSAPGPGTGA
ncbi:site-specific integrase [Streptomyces sp. NBC_01003]|uniref:site-specific integrase n=1 Tax=Streptomyces sp. NBC_01003 TaxID=2903714 RepID=UPI00386BEDDF